MRLENWSIASDYGNPYLAPELRKARLFGEIYDDDRGSFADGTEVSTSKLIEFDPVNMIAKTRNSTYQLGVISDSFATYMLHNEIKLEDYGRKML